MLASARKGMNTRQLTTLALVALLGISISHLLQSTRSLGQYVGENASAVQIGTSRRSPETHTGAADVTVVVFTDYQCPACRKSHRAMQSAIARDGNIRLVYKDWPIFGDRSERTAELALAAERQGIYEAVHNSLMRSRSLDDATFRTIVEAAGGSWWQIQADVARRKLSIAQQLNQNHREALILGLQGTPGYLIGPFLIEGALTEREFLRAFAQARAKPL